MNLFLPEPACDGKGGDVFRIGTVVTVFVRAVALSMLCTGGPGGAIAAGIVSVMKRGIHRIFSLTCRRLGQQRRGRIQKEGVGPLDLLRWKNRWHSRRVFD